MYRNEEAECWSCGGDKTQRPHLREQSTYECIRLESDVESELTKALARVKELEAEKEKLTNFYLRQVARLTERVGLMQSKHKGNEQNLTYHAGLRLGYVEGQLRTLHDVFDVEVKDESI